MKEKKIKKVTAFVCVAILVFSILTSAAGALVNTGSPTEEGSSEIILVNTKDIKDISVINEAGFKVMDRYNNYVLIKGDQEEQNILEQNGIDYDALNERTVISVKGHEFDFTEEEPSLSLKSEGYEPGTEGTYLVHMLGPINPEWKTRLENMGVRVLEYIPNYAYLVKMTPDMRKNVKSLDFVDWTGIYHPGYKIDEEIKQAKNIEKAHKVKVFIDGQVSFSSVTSIVSNIDKVKGYSKLHSGEYKVMIETKSKQDIKQIAENPDVMRIAPYKKKELKDEIGTQIAGGFFNQNEPGNAPYRGEGEYGSYANQLGYKGQGFTIQVADTGLGDGSTPNAGVPDFTGRVKGGTDLGSTVNGWFDDHGHGTHCAGLATGDTYEGTGVTYDGWTDFYVGQGSAPEADLWASQIFDNGGSGDLPSDYYDIPADGKVNGDAYISTNSWGESRGDSQYAETDTAYDNAVIDANPNEDGNQPMSIFVSAGNGGSANAITSPATAKNVIAVGASQNYMPDATQYGNTDKDVSNPANIASFSSKGYEMDGRVKPDVAAPGEGTLSTSTPELSSSNLYGLYSEDNRYEWCSGTSQAGPTAAGAGAVIASWYQESYEERPSPEMIKALMINAAKDMNDEAGNTEPIPNPAEGWGRVFLPPIVSDDMYPGWSVWDRPNNLETGQSDSYDIRVADQEHPLNITLAYTDAPGAPDSGTESKPALKNDLWLKVKDPSGDMWYGNAFENGMSVSGNGKISESFDTDRDNNDDRNNIENVFIPKSELETGTYTVEVVAKNVVEDVVPSTPEVDQTYALAAFNTPTIGGKNATLTLNKKEYQANSTVKISLSDIDLKGKGSYDLEITSTTEPSGEIVELNETGEGVFTGNITTNLTDKPGVLHVSHDDTIKAHYLDEDPGYDASVGNSMNINLKQGNKPMATDDVGVTEITSPGDRVNTSTHSMSSTVHNYGTNDLTDVPVNTTITENVKLIDENFNDGIPSDWTIDNKSDPSWFWDDGYSFDTPYAMVEEADGVWQNEYLITPKIDASSATDTHLKFDSDFYNSSYSGDSYGDVLISNDNGQTWNRIERLGDSEGTYTFDISSYADGNSDVKVAFRFNSTDGTSAYDDWSIDNVEVYYYAQEYTDETTIDVNAGANTTATLNDWTPSTEGQFKINSTTKLSGDTGPSNDSVIKYVTVIDDHDVAASEIVSPIGFTPGEPEEVIANVSNEGTFDETFPVNATIYQKDYKMSEDFDDNIPENWTIKNKSSETWQWDDGWDFDTPYAYVDILEQEWQDEWLITPTINASEYTNTAFQFRSDFYDSGARAEVLVSSDNGSTWNQIANLTGDNDGLQSYDISSYADGESEVKIAWVFNSTLENYVYGDWAIDDFKIYNKKQVYTDQLTTSVEAGKTKAVQFDNFTAPSTGDYLINVTTLLLESDMDHSNDYIEEIFKGHIHDVGPIEPVNPMSPVLTESQAVNATITNYGTIEESGVPVTAEIKGYSGSFESFTGDFPPEGWTTESGDWSQASSAEAGGTAPEANLYWDDITEDYSYLQSKPQTTSGEIHLSFNSYIDKYWQDYGDFSCRVLVRSSGADSWTDVSPWENPVPYSVYADSYSIDISNHTGVGTQVRFEFEGAASSIDNWYIDNVHIGGRPVVYSDSTTVDVPRDEDVTANFVDWTPSSVGSFTMNVTTDLSSEMDNSNDYFTKEIVVQPTDVEATLIDIPKKTTYHYEKAPKATITNVGYQNVTDIPVNLTIEEIHRISEDQTLNQNFSNGLPSDWSKTDVDGNGVTWTDAYGEYMEIRARDKYEEGMLQTRSINLTNAKNKVWLEFNSTYYAGASNSRDLMISFDNGTNWRRIGTNIGQGHIERDLSDLAEGKDQVKIGWRFYSTKPEGGEFWRIDDVSIGGEYLTSEYTNETVVSKLDMGNETKVSTFENWTPTNNTDYLVTLTTLYPDDDIATNNEITKRIEVLQNYPPNKPNDPQPFDGKENIPAFATLKVNVTDPNENLLEPLSVDFYVMNSSGQEVWNGSVTGVKGNIASIETGMLETNETHTWYAEVSDGFETNMSDTWSFTTYAPTPMWKNTTATIDASAPKQIENPSVDWNGKRYVGGEDTIYHHGFENGQLSPWSVASGTGFVDVTTDDAYEGNYSLVTGEEEVNVHSPEIDLTTVDPSKSDAVLSMWIKASEVLDDPESGDDIWIEYKNETDEWNVLGKFEGGTAGQVYTPEMTLPTDALHENFAINVHQISGTGSDYDFWHVDDVEITVRNFIETENNIITWDSSPDDGGLENDVDHYNLYRSQSETGPWDSSTMIKEISADGSSSYTYIDEDKGMDGIKWNYLIRAIDNVGNKEMNENVFSELSTPKVSNPTPGHKSEVSGTTQTISIDAETPTGDSMTVMFFNHDTDKIIGKVTGVKNETASVEWQLSQEGMTKNHNWYVMVTYENSNYLTKSPGKEPISSNWKWMYDADHRSQLDSAMGMNSEGTWYGGMIQDLSGQVGKYITDVAYFNYGNNASYVQAHVARNSGGAPGQWVGSSAEYTPKQTGWIELELKSLVEIRSPGEYWIVLEIGDKGADAYQFGVKSGYVDNAFYGNFDGDPHNSGDWQDLGGSYDYSWLIESKVTEYAESYEFYLKDTINPTANAGQDKSVKQFNEVTFDGSASTDNIGVTGYTWTIEGEDYAGETVSYTFSEVGTYEVELTVNDAAGNNNTDTISVDVIDNEAPNANMGIPGSVNVNRDFKLNASGSTDNVGITSHTWIIDGIEYNGEEITHSFSELGTHEIKLRVEDAEGNVDVDSLTITAVDDISPVAEAGEDMTIDEDTEVTFDASDSSDNDMIVNYTWNIMGEHYYGEQITEKFTEPGVYQVDLIVKDEQGNMNTDTITITVNDVTKPSVDLSVNKQTVGLNEMVSFDASGSSDNVAVTGYTWTINGQEYSGEMYSYAFSETGDHEVTLTVTDEAGNTNSTAVTITVEDQTAPVAEFGSDMNIKVGSEVSFNGSGSYDNLGITNYTWNIAGEEKTGETTEYTFDQPGEYEATLTVTDDAGNTDSKTVIITVKDETAPVAKFDSKLSTTVGSQVTFDGSRSSDNVEVTSYTWNIAGEEKTGETTEYTFDQPGEYEATLTVTDDAGNTGQISKTITVNDVTSPEVSISAPSSTPTGENVTFDGSGSTDNVKISSYKWSINGKEYTGENIEREFDKPGTYTVALRVTDEAGNTARGTMDIEVNDNENPTAKIDVSNTTISVTDKIRLDASESSDNIRIDSYEWDLGNGETSNGEKVYYEYSTADTYTVKLTVTDEAGNTGTKTVDIQVKKDANDNGIPDEYEEAYNLEGANKDPDGDGFDNLKEYKEGTDPRNADSNPGLGAVFYMLPIIIILVIIIAVMYWKYNQGGQTETEETTEESEEESEEEPEEEFFSEESEEVEDEEDIFSDEDFDENFE